MGVNIGFIGTGVIASALVTGFCSIKDADCRITLSPRNAERAAALAARFENVTVAASNQEVLDRSEWVVLSVVPKFGEEILRPLSFRKDHQVVSLLSDRKLAEVASWIGETRSLTRMIPLPFAAHRVGPIAIHPYGREVEALFGPLGQIVAIDEEKRIEVVSAITALMSSYHSLLRDVVQWGEREGLSKKEAFDYTTSFFEALSFQARHVENGDLDHLAGEMTPGGLNEMALLSITKQEGFELWLRALDPVLARLRK